MSRSSLPLLGLVALLAFGCPPSEDDTGDDTSPDDTSDSDVPTPYVSVSATDVYLLVGETTTLAATTANATDAGYAWETSDALVATVDSAGVVTGRGHGSVRITATGATTTASGHVDLTVSEEVPYLEEWSGSAHAAYDTEPFTHWDEDGEVPSSCAKCHTTTGYRDYLGDDGTAADAMNGPHPIGQVVECVACHNSTASALDHVVFPSGVIVEGLGPEAICMTCHQGRASKDSVDAEIADAQSTGTEPAGEDLVDPDIGFVNIHYYAAGATLFGGAVRGGYQYDGLLYDQRFRHVSSRDTCTECHDQHTLAVRVDACVECHPSVTTQADARDLRMMASASRDYDGDGDLDEGLHDEVAGLRDLLYGAIKAGAQATTGAARICYDPASHPYWYVDTNANGTCDAAEVTSSNSYKTWSPRLMKAAYQYQLAQKDPGSYVHNGKYVIELLHDAIVELNEITTTDVDLSDAVRSDPGHFDGTAEAFRHWDEDEAVDGSCSQCHGGADGFSFYLQYGVTVDVLEVPNGLQCETCHGDWNYQGTTELVTVSSVKFPGGTTLSGTAWAEPNDMICATCHQGRESKKTIDDYLAINNGTPGKYPTFRNVHYLPAAATLQGSAAHVGYEYDGETYTGKWMHYGPSTAPACGLCHDGDTTDHTFDPRDVYGQPGTPCTSCHASFPDADNAGDDYDGNAATTTLAADLDSYQDALLVALNEYALDDGRARICYNEGRYPYWFVDATPFGGRCGAEDTAGYPKSATGWDAEMVKAAHNFQLSVKDPGAWAHNMDYVTELLYDSIARLDASQLGTLSRGQP